jgi:pimeloyl-ACP methyl ester carboxylesterase
MNALEGREGVVLLHGLGRTAASMRPIEKALRAAGYLVVNDGYPSTREPIERLAGSVGSGIAKCRAAGATGIHFVTHSLGGILVRSWFQDHTAPEARRLVMLGPPNHGSEIADRRRGAAWYRWLTGPAGQQLGTEASSAPNRCGPIPLEIGVIAGTLSAEPWFAGSFDGPNDGKVAVASARLAGMRDFLTVPRSHTFMMRSDVVIRQVLAFLREGRFEGDRASS